MIDMIEQNKSSGKLTENERKIILNNVIQSKIPVTISTATSKIEINSDKLQILDSKIILLTNATAELLEFAGNEISVQFSFSGMSFSFTAKMMSVNAGLAFAIPDTFHQVNKTEKKSFSFTLFFEVYEKVGEIRYKNKHDIKCLVKNEYFIEKNADAIKNIEKYLSDSNNKDNDVPEVVFVNQEKVALGFSKEIVNIKENTEYAAWIIFPLKRPLKERKIYISFIVEKIFKGKNSEEKSCALGKISAIKLEDIRFLHEYFN